MEIETVKVGYLETNCYILKKQKHAIVIDPGSEYNKIIKKIGDYSIDAIFITHNHFDHIGALKYFKDVPSYDYKNIQDFKSELFTFEVIKTPGHTSDSITLYFKKEQVMFVGDFIFKNSIGRTDLDTGSDSDMQKSIEMIKKYSDNIVLYPGHGEATTLGREKEQNIYFR